MLRPYHIFAVLPLTAILWGCGPEEMLDESGGGSTIQEVPATGTGTGADETEPMLATLTQDLSVIGAYAWAAPEPATPMGSTSNRVCVLNRIQGAFDSRSDYIHAFAAGGSWYLGGDTSYGPLGGSSRCAELPSGASFTGEYSWTSAQNYPTHLGSATGRVCFLTRVAGSFEGGADWVHVYVSGGAWYLWGSSPNASARARCVTVSSYSGEYSWNQSMTYSTHMGSTSGRVCALTYMRGNFDGWSEQIRIFASSGSWYLGGASQQFGVAARARCF